MSAVTGPQSITVDDYLQGELQTDIKHEYLDGQVVAMGGASRAHGLLAGGLHALLLPHARRKGCQLFIADMKVRIEHDNGSCFYYPDLVASCDPSGREPLYTRSPCLIVEVLSPTTERIDTVEKLLAYRLLPSLREYLLLRQDCMQADLYQLGADGRWQHRQISEGRFVLNGLDAEVVLADVYVDLDLSAAEK